MKKDIHPDYHMIRAANELRKRRSLWPPFLFHYFFPRLDWEISIVGER